MLKKLRSILKDKTEDIAKKLTEKEISEEDLKDVLWDMEISLLESNVSLEIVELLNTRIKDALIGKKLSSLEIKDKIKASLKSLLDELLLEGEFLERIREKETPRLIIFIGFNGVGKTTTIAKLGKFLLDKRYSVIFAAGDTYRAGAIEQLEEHARNLNIKVIKNRYGADSAAVIYDAVRYAESHKIDFVLADTAGRVHINKNLIDELQKIIRVNKPSFIFLVIDSTTGNDAISQAKLFNEVGFDGYIITKFDADNKGGTFLNVCYAIKKPIFFLGTGQGYEDLEIFKKEKIISKLIDF